MINLRRCPPSTFSLALILLTVLIVYPAGNFPLNDDWIYAEMVKRLLDEHRFVQGIYNSPYAIVQTFWGAAFCAMAGYSYTTLRLSTLVCAFVAIWLVARCARESGASRGVAMLCAAIVFANPLFLNLSYSFMTEVPYLALMLASGWFYLRALRRGSAMTLLLGSTFAVLSFLNRQYGVLSTVALLFALLFADRQALLRPRPRMAAAFFMPWAFMVGIVTACGTGPGSPFHVVGIAGTVSVVKQIVIIVNALFAIPLYGGLFLFPVAYFLLGRACRRAGAWRISQWAAFFAVVGVYALAFMVGARPLPLLPNILRNTGVGPLTLWDTYFKNPAWSPVSVPQFVWYALSTAAAIAAGALTAHLLGSLLGTARTSMRSQTLRVRRTQHLFLIVWAFLLAFSPFNPGLNIYFDRYLLPACIPMLLYAAAGLNLRGKFARLWIGAPVAAMYIFSIVSLQDYLAWNRARWDAIETLRSKYGAVKEQIDGGYEFNGLYTSDAFRALHADRPAYYSGERPWWVIEEKYAVSFLPRDGYETIDTLRYDSWLSGERSMLVLKKR